MYLGKYLLHASGEGLIISFIQLISWNIRIMIQGLRIFNEATYFILEVPNIFLGTYDIFDILKF